MQNVALILLFATFILILVEISSLLEGIKNWSDLINEMEIFGNDEWANKNVSSIELAIWDCLATI